MYVIFRNPGGYPDRMRVRDEAQLQERMVKLAEKGHPITIVEICYTAIEVWAKLINHQQDYKAERRERRFDEWVKKHT
jgi:hypothetical protein